MKIAPFRLLPGRSAPRARDDAALVGLNDRDLSPRAKAKLVELLGDLDRLREEASQLSARVAELETLADTDPLANVMNRRAFMRELARALAFSARHGGPVSVLYLDLVGFKAINDAHGHRAGDAALVHVAELLETHVRVTDAVGRIGGDEFGVVLAQADAEQARRKAEDLRERLRAEPPVYDGVTLDLDVSIGVHQAERNENADDALRAADQAMYDDKRAAQASKNRPEAVTES